MSPCHHPRLTDPSKWRIITSFEGVNSCYTIWRFMGRENPRVSVEEDKWRLQMREGPMAFHVTFKEIKSLNKMNQHSSSKKFMPE